MRWESRRGLRSKVRRCSSHFCFCLFLNRACSKVCGEGKDLHVNSVQRKLSAIDRNE